jgi:hypothetical protein
MSDTVVSDIEILNPMPRKPREKIKIPGRTEEEIRKIKCEKIKELQKGKRARNRQYKEKKKLRKRIFLTACYENEFEGTEENTMKLIVEIAHVCAKYNVTLFETCQARYGKMWVDRHDLCKMEVSGNAKQILEEELGRELHNL